MDGQWVDVWVSNHSPVAARVVVTRGTQRFPAVARYKAYVQTKRDGNPNSIWAQRDAEQLEKCAEALALRKAFPQDLSGIFTTDEMAASTDHVEPRRQTPAQTPAQTPTGDLTAELLGEIVEEPEADQPEPMKARTRGKMFALFGQKGIAEDQQLAGINHVVRGTYTSRGQITEADALLVIAQLETRPDVDIAHSQQDGGES